MAKTLTSTLFALSSFKKTTNLLAFFAATAALFYCRFPPAESAPRPQSPSIWITAYYPVWEQLWGMPPSEIDYSSFTHLIQFSIEPNADGTIDQTSPNAVTPAVSSAIIVPAHAAGDKVLICLGGMNSGPALETAIGDPVRLRFIDNLVKFVSLRGYDGIDIDMEPVTDSDQPTYVQFVRELRAAMKHVDHHLLLTVAASANPNSQPAMYSTIQRCFDQINLMSYDLSGNWPGWKTWYNASLNGNSETSMTATVPYPSVSAAVARYVAAGVARSKIGIGIPFYGNIWSGADGPQESIAGVTTATMSYTSIMTQFYQPGSYHWDNLAGAPYLSISRTPTAPAKFISYDDPRSCADKVMFTRTQHLGGVMVFEIGNDYNRALQKGARNPLMQAVKAAASLPLTPGKEASLSDSSTYGRRKLGP